MRMGGSAALVQPVAGAVSMQHRKNEASCPHHILLLPAGKAGRAHAYEVRGLLDLMEALERGDLNDNGQVRPRHSPELRFMV